MKKGADSSLRNISDELPIDLCLVDETKKMMMKRMEKVIIIKR